jgi:hypothetical protein
LFFRALRDELGSDDALQMAFEHELRFEPVRPSADKSLDVKAVAQIVREMWRASVPFDDASNSKENLIAAGQELRRLVRAMASLVHLLSVEEGSVNERNDNEAASEER